MKTGRSPLPAKKRFPQVTCGNAITIITKSFRSKRESLFLATATARSDKRKSTQARQHAKRRAAIVIYFFIDLWIKSVVVKPKMSPTKTVPVNMAQFLVFDFRKKRRCKLFFQKILKTNANTHLPRLFFPRDRRIFTGTPFRSRQKTKSMFHCAARASEDECVVCAARFLFCPVSPSSARVDRFAWGYRSEASPMLWIS